MSTCKCKKNQERPLALQDVAASQIGAGKGKAGKGKGTRGKADKGKGNKGKSASNAEYVIGTSSRFDASSLHPGQQNGFTNGT